MARGCTADYVNAEWSFYRFEPSTAAAVFFCVVYVLTTGLHIFQLVRTKTWYMTAFVIGGLCEVIGYAARAQNTTQEPGCWTLGPYIIQNVLLLIAPALMAASIYMILGRIIMLTDGESHALIKRRFLTKIFVSGDVLSLLMQSSGGGMMASGASMMDLGEKVIIVGLFIQLAVFGFFIIVAALFHRRMVLVPTAKSHQPEIRWRYYLLTLYVTSVLIWVRSIFRVIEYLEGNKGHLMTNEAYVYVFDATLMFLVMVWMNWFHPSEIGLLLRGEPPIKNGLELVMMKRKFGKVQNESSSMSA
ncbi:RTA1 like protein-domain-containing protein [Colletotrichum phormii]|uniref:RTA1 like protein-domain-containing protein n=1 Tax=Colletotrichum phormii TaxID=359342 RepID=A0AAI9ZKC0_9PEZI|nr:RTA1 like protein-domain-containing protein [Colletotrichum phormii]KAK1624864.1 RTA1 like protein-domain-containing protein [Colletotrichum phormii]